MKDEAFIQCWNLNNLRPYSAKDNVKDGAKRVRHKKRENSNNVIY